MPKLSHAERKKQTDLDAKEGAVVGTLLAEFPAELPPCCAKLLEHAPDSFDDLRYGNIGLAIRHLQTSGKPIAPLTVREYLQQTNRLDDAGGALFLDTLGGQAVGVSIAEYEATDLWEAHRTRRLKSVYGEAFAAMEADPTKADTILAGVRHSLEALDKEHGSGNGFTIRRPDELLAMTFDESDRILGDRLLATGQSLVIAGAGAIGKSRLLLQLAVATITGRPFIGLETRQPQLKWLILQAENSNRRLQSDLASLREWTGPKVWPRVNGQLLIHTLETDSDGFLSLDSPETVRRIAKVIAEFQPDVVCFDSLYNFALGDMNSDQDMRETLTAISRLAKTGNPERAIVVLHHALTGRAGAARATGFDRASFGRNSKVLHSWARGQINIAPGTAESNDTLILSCGKCANGKEFPVFAIRLNPGTMIYEVAPDFDLEAWQGDMGGRKEGPSVTPELVQRLCKGKMTKRQLVKAVMDDTGCGKSLAYRTIDRAKAARKLQHDSTEDTYVAR
jgi:archaellum biogenesis ATPase FlaH